MPLFLAWGKGSRHLKGDAITSFFRPATFTRTSDHYRKVKNQTNDGINGTSEVTHSRFWRRHWGFQKVPQESNEFLNY